MESTKFKEFRIEKEEGFSLLQVMITIGLLGIVVTTMNTALRNGFAANSHMEGNIDFQAIKRVIVEGLDCQKTLNLSSPMPVPGSKPSICAKTKNIPIKRANGSMMAPKFKLGRWFIKTTCEATGLDIRLTKRDTKGNVIKDYFYNYDIKNNSAKWSPSHC